MDHRKLVFIGVIWLIHLKKTIVWVKIVICETENNLVFRITKQPIYVLIRLLIYD